MPDLRPDKARDLGRLMLELHGDFRKRHGLPPVPTSWTLSDHLDLLRSRTSLIEPELLSSPRPVIGTVLEKVRKALVSLLYAVFHRQSEQNRDVVLALEALMRDSEARRCSHDALSARIVELERKVERLEGSGE